MFYPFHHQDRLLKTTLLYSLRIVYKKTCMNIHLYSENFIHTNPPPILSSEHYQL